jgi:hypothetical protein
VTHIELADAQLLRNGASLRISATKVHCTVPDGGSFRESLAC